MTKTYLNELTADEVKNHLEYRDGELWWIKPARGRNLGKRAGTYTKEGYRQIRVNNVTYREHRVIWLYFYGVWPSKILDHIDGDPGNNRIENLREATIEQNAWNAKVSFTNKSGFKGVRWDEDRQRYSAVIRVKGKRRYLGRFRTKTEAIEAYTKAASYRNDFLGVNHAAQ